MDVSGNFMGASFSDITLYTPIECEVGTDEYRIETAFQNYISDLYVQKMHGYKPPGVTRITIQPAFHKIWNRTWKNGSIVAIAPYYNHDEYSLLDKIERSKYILDLIQFSTMQLSEEYNWDKSIFEKAYREVIESNFKLSISYPAKMSRNRSMKAGLHIEKTEEITSVFIILSEDNHNRKVKLFDKENKWWYDCIYYLARCTKWYDADRFGIAYGKGKIDIWYSISENKVEMFESSIKVDAINFKIYFLFG